MTLNSTGPISLGGSTTGQSVNLEVQNSATTTISFNDSKVRTLTGTSAGSTLTMPTNFYGASYNYTVSYVIVGGGGGGGSGVGSAGGGAGQVLSGTTSITPGTSYTVTIGTGGGSDSNGTSTTFGSLLTAIGGYGNGNSGNGYSPGSSGGNGGWGGGAGGGAATNGSDGYYPNNGANGDSGIAITLTGSTINVGGGGAGGSYGGGGTGYGLNPGSGGSGGGGNGGTSPPSGNQPGGNGTANTGGGGGSGSSTSGGTGGTGVFIISIPTSRYSGTFTGTPVITTNGSNTVLKFNASGSYTA